MNSKLLVGTVSLLVTTSFNTPASDSGHYNFNLQQSVVDFRERGRNAPTRLAKISNEHPI